MHVLRVEVSVKLRRDAAPAWSEDVLKARRRIVPIHAGRLPLFPETLRGNHLGVWVCCFPGGDMDVVFHVQGSYVGHTPTESCDRFANFWGEADGGEDGYGAG